MDERADRRDEARVLVLNPVSGSGDQVDDIRELATERGFEVRETAEAGDAVAFARDAAPDADLLAAAGGDGTLNEVVRGAYEADALADVDLAVVPAGTGNNFAANVGVRGVEHAFEVIDDGERRRIDLGVVSLPDDDADERPFVNSCVAGLTADASAHTDADSKRRLGVLAYVLSTLRTAVEFDGLALYVETDDEFERTWNGDAEMVLVGNGRRFPSRGSAQANMEDGLLDIAIVERRPTAELARDLTAERLLGSETSGITRLRTPGLHVSVRETEAASFSLDGEMLSGTALAIDSRHRVLSMCVGPEYRPDPDADG